MLTGDHWGEHCSPASLKLPLSPGDQQCTQGLALPRCQGSARILKSVWTVSYIIWKAGSGCEDVGQQEVPWDSGDSAVGGCGDVLKDRREGRKFGELDRDKYKVHEVIEESV